MLGAIRVLEAAGAKRSPRVLSKGEITGLEENARLVANKYWATRGKRASQSIQNQLNRPRWHYVRQAPFALDVMNEICADSGMKMAYYP